MLIKVFLKNVFLEVLGGCWGQEELAGWWCGARGGALQVHVGVCGAPSGNVLTWRPGGSPWGLSCKANSFRSLVSCPGL